ncbi:site-2 protease family protein [Alkalilacustris brevis]|uniref:site-2 protease family protein n=1 Tax=Alkalilacustris brevis TaxID=2026338 RepID=UPI000E0D2C2B|nr:site-2 protease family protein [Alkalilacustris brevis]
MTWSFPIGTLLGSELRVHATFFLLLAWIGAAAWLAGGPVAAAMNILFILVLFACVVAHEFGHALMARRYGIRTPDITLLPIGGMARLERMPEKPAQEIAVALAGPAVNVVIWAVLVFVIGVDTSVEALLAIEDPREGFWARVAVVNLFLVLFNMLPAFPMDGGRVLRALLAMRMPREKATLIAARGGQAMAFVFGFLGLMTGNPLLILIAVFVFIAGMAESSHVAMQEFGRHQGVRDAMITSFEWLREDSTLHEAANTLIRTTQHEFPVLDAGGRPVGFLTRRDLYAALAEDVPRMREIRGVIDREVPMVHVGAPLNEAIEAMQRTGSTAVGVVGPSGALIGYITHENIGELMVVSGRG